MSVISEYSYLGIRPPSSPQLFIEPEAGVITLLANNQEWGIITLISELSLLTLIEKKIKRKWN